MQAQLLAWGLAPTPISPDEDDGAARARLEADLLRVLRIDRSLEVSFLLDQLGAPERLSPDESEDPREDRLYGLQTKIGFKKWFDGSPNLNRNWVTWYYMLQYDSLRFRLTPQAQLECRRPRLYMLLPFGEHASAVLAVCRVHADDMRTLNRPLLASGIEWTVMLAGLKHCAHPPGGVPDPMAASLPVPAVRGAGSASRRRFVDRACTRPFFFRRSCNYR